jgi:Protein of unknown function (DUF3455)
MKTDTISVSLLAALAFAAVLHAEPIRAPDVPDAIKASPGESVVLRAHASGAQIYTCGHNEMGAPQWVLKGPDAVLRDGAGKLIGQHSVGPSWKYKDGSSVTGKAVAHVDALDPAAVPWLKVQATAHDGQGLLEHVSTVQRIRTRGGQPPDAARCTPANQNEETSVPYTADYYFYAPAVPAAH